MTDRQNPDSRLLREREIGKIEIVQVWRQSEPQPRPYVWADLLPVGATTALYGDGGNGKSFFATALGTHIALGRPFLGRSVVQGPVLYVDAELDPEEFVRRAYRIARGIGLERPPDGFFYHRLGGSLADPAIVYQVQAAVDQIQPVTVMLDSVMAATFGADLERANDTTTILKQVEMWGTLFTIDHIAKPTPGANLSQYRQYGSVFKYNLARSVLQVVQADGGGQIIRQTKHNFGPKVDPFGLSMEFSQDRVTFTAIDTNDVRLSGIEDHLPAAERVLRALADYPGGATPDDLAAELEMSSKTVRNHLTTLRQRGLATSDNGGTWRPNSRFPVSYRDRDRENDRPAELSVSDDKKRTPKCRSCGAVISIVNASGLCGHCVGSPT